MSGVWGCFHLKKKEREKKNQKQEARLLCISTSLGQGAEVREVTSTLVGVGEGRRRVFCVQTERDMT